MGNNVLSRILKVFSTTLFLYYSLFYFSFHVSDEIILWKLVLQNSFVFLEVARIINPSLLTKSFYTLKLNYYYRN